MSKYDLLIWPAWICLVKKTAIGYSLDYDDHWKVNCPDCGEEFEYEGFFDPEDITECTCGCTFKTEKIVFENGDFIK